MTAISWIKQAFRFCPLKSFMSYWVKYNNQKWPTRWQLLSGFVFNLYYNLITVLENDTIEALISTFYLECSYLLVSFQSSWKWIVEKRHKQLTPNLYLGLAVPLLFSKNLMAKKYHNTCLQNCCSSRKRNKDARIVCSFISLTNETCKHNNVLFFQVKFIFSNLRNLFALGAGNSFTGGLRRKEGRVSL